MKEKQSNGYANPKQLLKAKRRYADVDTAYGRMRVRSLTAREELESQAAIAEGGGKTGPAYVQMRIRQIVRGVCDEHGHAVFTDRDGEAIGGMDAATFNRLADAITDLSGSDKELAKNLETTTQGSSP